MKNMTKTSKWPLALLVLLAGSVGAGGEAGAKLSEPDVVYFGALSGAVAGNSLTLKLDADGTLLSGMVVGSGASYLLRVPMDAVNPRTPGSARSGDRATLYLGDKAVRSVVIPDRGGLINLPLSANALTLADWNRLHPGDDGSGDKNHNGISDLQDFLNGNDPSFVWSALTLSTLPDKGVATGATLNLAGTVSDNGSGNGVKSITGNGQPGIISNGGFSIALPLVDGPNLITTVATDSADNKTIDTRTVTFKSSAPALTITRLPDNSVTSAGLADLAGSVADPGSTVTALANDGSPIAVLRDGANFSLALNLAPGMNTIGLTVTDLTGNFSNAKRTVISDAAAPTLAIGAPAQDISTALLSITLSGSVSDPAGAATVSIAVDDQVYTPAVAADGSFSQEIAMATEKTYSVLATATGQGGNKATVQRNIIRTAPVVTVDLSSALKVLRLSLGLDSPTAADYANADVAPIKDGKPAPDGVIDIADVVVTLEKLVGVLNW